MKETEFKTKRLTATTPEEKAIIKSWGSLWQRFGQLERSGRKIVLVFGDWSGYRSSQYRITHVDYFGYYHKVDSFTGGIVMFTDNTTMSVWIKEVTRRDILSSKYRRATGYTSLINDMLKSGQTYYKV